MKLVSIGTHNGPCGPEPDEWEEELEDYAYYENGVEYAYPGYGDLLGLPEKEPAGMEEFEKAWEELYGNKEYPDPEPIDPSIPF